MIALLLITPLLIALLLIALLLITPLLITAVLINYGQARFVAHGPALRAFARADSENAFLLSPIKGLYGIVLQT